MRKPFRVRNTLAVIQRLPSFVRANGCEPRWCKDTHAAATDPKLLPYRGLSLGNGVYFCIFHRLTVAVAAYASLLPLRSDVTTRPCPFKTSHGRPRLQWRSTPQPWRILCRTKVPVLGCDGVIPVSPQTPRRGTFPQMVYRLRHWFLHCRLHCSISRGKTVELLLIDFDSGFDELGQV